MLYSAGSTNYTYDVKTARQMGFIPMPYFRVYVPTGEKSRQVIYCRDYADLCIILNKFNAGSGDKWLYYC